MISRHATRTFLADAISLQPALPPLSFALYAGECLALLFLDDTENALQLLADILAGHRRPTAGRLVVGEEEITSRPSGARSLVVVGPRDGLFEHLSVRDNVAFPLRARRRPAQEITHRVEQMLALLGLDKWAYRRPAALKPADRIRVAVARALTTDPAVIVLEDIFSGLDSEARSGLHNRLSRLQRARNISMLLLTRDRGDAVTGAHRIGVVAQGHLLQTGTASQLIERPASARVAVAMADANVLVGMALDIEDDIVRARLACGGEMEALADADIEVNDVVDLCIRPNQIAPMMSRGALPDETEGSLPATLTDIRNVGDLLTLRFRLADGTEVTVHRPPGSLPPGTAPGQTALLAWRPSAALAFSSEAKPG